MKVGRRMGTMITRYYVLRDQALYIYMNKNDVFPKTVIPLRGIYINLLRPSQDGTTFGFALTHDTKHFKQMFFYHRNQEYIVNWIRSLKQ